MIISPRRLAQAMEVGLMAASNSKCRNDSNLVLPTFNILPPNSTSQPSTSAATATETQPPQSAAPAVSRSPIKSVIVRAGSSSNISVVSQNTSFLNSLD